MTTVQNITNQVVEQILSSIAQGIEVKPELYEMILETVIEIEGITFENRKAQFFFTEAVTRSLSKDLYYSVFPKAHTNANGVTTFSK